MPTIKVNTSKLESYESQMQGIFNRVNSIMNQFNSVSRNLDWDVKAESDINYMLSNISRELSAEAYGTKGMKNFLGTAISKYDAVESNNTEKSDESAKEKSSFWEQPFGKWIKKTLSGSMIVGVGVSLKDIQTTFKNADMISLVNEFYTPENLEKWANVGKNTYKAIKNTLGIIRASQSKNNVIGQKIIELYQASEHSVGNAKKITKEAKSDFLKKVFGMEDSIGSAAKAANIFIKDGVVKQSWGARFADQFSATFKTSAQKLTKSAGIISSVITVVSNGISNYSDWKKGKMSGTRAVAETITESAVDIGTDLVVGSAVTAGLAATIGSAPVLLVGAVSAGVIIGADCVCKYVTKNFTKEKEEKGLTETISDAVLDAGKRDIQDKYNKAVAVYNIGSRVVSAISGG